MCTSWESLLLREPRPTARDLSLPLGLEPLNADLAAPGSLRRLLDGRDEAVHVVAAVAVVAEEQLVVVLAGAAERAALALDALPRVLLHADDHVVRELQARGVAWKKQVSSLGPERGWRSKTSDERTFLRGLENRANFRRKIGPFLLHLSRASRKKRGSSSNQNNLCRLLSKHTGL